MGWKAPCTPTAAANGLRARGLAGPGGVHRELKRKDVTLTTLRDEYIAANPSGYSYSRFCDLYRAFANKVSVTNRRHMPLASDCSSHIPATPCRSWNR